METIIFATSMPGMNSPTTKRQDTPKFFFREWRKKRRLTQEKLAEMVGVSPPSISQLENGKQGFTDTTLLQLAQALGCHPGELLMKDPAAASDDWRGLLRKAVLAASSDGATPEDIRGEIVRIAPLPGIEVLLDPSMTEAQEKMLKDLSETSAARLGNRKSESK